jgi:hypothetical protein
MNLHQSVDLTLGARRVVKPKSYHLKSKELPKSVTNPKDGQVKAEMVEESLEERPLVNQQDQDGSSQEEDDLDDQEDEDVPDEVQTKKKVATLRVNQEKVQYAEESKIREAQETLQRLKEIDRDARIKFETQLRKGLKPDMKTPTSQQNINKMVLIPKNMSTPKQPSKSVYQNSESGISTSSRESEPPLQKILKSLKEQKYTDAKPRSSATFNITQKENLKGFFQGMAKPKLPKFGGERDEYQDWRAQYEIFVHQADVPSHFKMMMLKQASIGKASTLIEKLGYTDSQYDMALLKLDQRYGGERRQLR